MRNQCEICVWVLFFLISVMAAAAAANLGTDATSSSSSSSTFSPRRIQQWIHKKCGGTNGAAVWVYEGALFDPLDGHKIANVQGLELVRQLADSSNEESSQRIQQLKAFEFTKKADYSATILSRRLFCYSSPQQPRRLLDSIRLRPNAPLRRIPVNQAVAVYDSATTFASCDDSLVVHTEWPNTKCTWGVATTTSTTPDKKQNADDDSSCLDFNVFTKPNHTPDVPDLSSLRSSSTSNNDIVAAPKRSRLIQFGTSSQPKQGNFGVRETYSYSITNNKQTKSRPQDWLDRVLRTTPLQEVSVKYTRYGEAPPWYGAGKYGLLELTGRRVASVEEAPPLAASIAAQRIPGFLSVNTPISSNHSASKAMEWFRRQDYLQLLDGEEAQDEEEPSNNNRLHRYARHVKRKSAQVFSKVRAASTLEQ